MFNKEGHIDIYRHTDAVIHYQAMDMIQPCLESSVPQIMHQKLQYFSKYAIYY